jgi:nitroreductase
MMDVFEALESRMSCRAFLSKPVPEAMIRGLVDKARQSPSGGNLQPWRVYVLAGNALAGLVRDVGKKLETNMRGEPRQYTIYPENLRDPYEARRVKCGEDMYASIGVERDDRRGRIAQFKRNFEMFGAPVGMFIYIDKNMGPPQWSDMGIFLQSVMLGARHLGLHSCAQEAWSLWSQTVGQHVQPDDDLMLFCGLAIGYMDSKDPINWLQTDRASLAEFAQFSGFPK